MIYWKRQKPEPEGMYQGGVAPQGLIHAVRAVTKGEVYVTPALANSILREMTQEETVDPFERLTPWEQDILLAQRRELERN